MPTKKTPSKAHSLPVPVEFIERRIYLIRGQKVMLDSDLAELYEAETKALTRARNLMKRGLDKLRAWKSATNGRGAWWNAGASHMNEAFPKSYFDRLGLASLLDLLRQLQFSK